MKHYAPCNNKVWKSFISCKCHSQGHKVIDLGFFWKGFINGIMPNVKSLSLRTHSYSQVDNRQTGQNQYTSDLSMWGYKNKVENSTTKLLEIQRLISELQTTKFEIQKINLWNSNKFCLNVSSTFINNPQTLTTNAPGSWFSRTLGANDAQSTNLGDLFSWSMMLMTTVLVLLLVITPPQQPPSSVATTGKVYRSVPPGIVLPCLRVIRPYTLSISNNSRILAPPMWKEIWSW